jgi:hypothetical protein
MTPEKVRELGRAAAEVHNFPLAALCRAAERGEPEAVRRLERILANPGKHEWEIES